jgi:hypothetical protein
MDVDQKYYQTPGHLVAAAVILIVLDVTVVTMRFCARRMQKQTPQVDDWLIIPATVSV